MLVEGGDHAHMTQAQAAAQQAFWAWRLLVSSRNATRIAQCPHFLCPSLQPQRVIASFCHISFGIETIKNRI
jgi:hypothetical protein